MDLSSKEITLLTKEQIFGKNTTYIPAPPIDVINKIGRKCAVTDFANILGAYPSLNEFVEYDKTNRGKTSFWYSSTEAYFSSIVSVDYSGKYSEYSFFTRSGGVRPVIKINNLDSILPYLVGENNGIKEIEYGYYPQYALHEEMQRKLNELFESGSLTKTGKTYTTDSSTNNDFIPLEHVEYEINGNRFVRVKTNRETTLSTGQKFEMNEYVWIQVSPIEWYVDEKEKLIISKNLLLGGLRVGPKNKDNDFKSTGMYTFLNTYFKKDIIQSNYIEKENTSSRREQYQKRTNPYGLNFKKVSEEEIIRGAIESGVAVFLHGKSSEGKSSRIKQIDKDSIIIYLRNASPERLNGKSVYDSSTGTMIDIKPTWLQKLEEICEKEPDKNHIVFFDEITNALPSVQGSAFNIILDREVNGIWKLPDNARIVAAGNDMNDSLAANRLAEPLFNRFAHVYIETTVDSWLKWASENNIHPAIYSYIAYKKGEVLRSTFDGEKPNADPRKWELASKMLYATGQPEMLRSLVGEEITNEFVTFCNQRVITLEDVLTNNYTDYDLQMNTSEKYATIVGLSQVDENNFELVRNFVSKLGSEFVAVFDSLWTHGNNERMDLVSEARLMEKDKVLCRFVCEDEEV